MHVLAFNVIYNVVSRGLDYISLEASGEG